MAKKDEAGPSLSDVQDRADEASETLAHLSGSALLLPYQTKWVEDPSPIKIAEKTRRCGLTWAEAADAALTASVAQGARHHLYSGANKEMAAEFIAACAAWAKLYGAATSGVEESLFETDAGAVSTYVLRFATGRRIRALSSSPVAIRGRQANVTIDEAAFHPDLHALLAAALPLRVWGAKIRIISTHNSVDVPYYDLVEQSRSRRLPYSLHSYPLDYCLDDGLYKRVCLVSGQTWSPEAEVKWAADLRAGSPTPEYAAEEYDCVPRKSGGAYLPYALIERACRADVPVLTWEPPADDFGTWPEPDRARAVQEWINANLTPLLKTLPQKPHVLGEDFARSGDLTVLLPLTLDDAGRTAPFAVEIAQCPFAQQRQILFATLDSLPQLRSVAMDAGGNGQQMAEDAADRYGRPRVQEIQLTRKIYAEAWPAAKRRLEDDEYALPRSQNWRDDLRSVTVEGGVPLIPGRDTRMDKTAGQKRHGDAAIAFLLADHASVAEPISYEHRQVPRPGTPRPDRSDRNAPQNTVGQLQKIL